MFEVTGFQFGLTPIHPLLFSPLCLQRVGAIKACDSVLYFSWSFTTLRPIFPIVLTACSTFHCELKERNRGYGDSVPASPSGFSVFLMRNCVKEGHVANDCLPGLRKVIPRRGAGL